MKFAAAVLTFIMAFFMALPLLSLEIKKAPETCCSSKKKSCNKDSEEPDKNDCNTKCNTSGSCAYCCWMMASKFIIASPSKLVQQKIIVVNDNRTIAHISDCWRPPNFNA